jgi:hypothetical protein
MRDGMSKRIESDIMYWVGSYAVYNESPCGSSGYSIRLFNHPSHHHPDPGTTAPHTPIPFGHIPCLLDNRSTFGLHRVR